jgi:hypothetical protein
MWKDYLAIRKVPRGYSSYQHVGKLSTPTVGGKCNHFGKFFTFVQNHELFASLVPRQLLSDNLWKLISQFNYAFDFKSN